MRDGCCGHEGTLDSCLSASPLLERRERLRHLLRGESSCPLPYDFAYLRESDVRGNAGYDKGSKILSLTLAVILRDF